MSESDEERRERIRAYRSLTPAQRKALDIPAPDNVDWEEMERVHQEQLRMSEGWEESLEIKPSEERQEKIKAFVKDAKPLLSDIQKNLAQISEGIAKKKVEDKEKNELWEKQYGRGVVAIKNHPFRSKKVVHKHEPKEKK